MAYFIGSDCIQCGSCQVECRRGAISEVDGAFVVDRSRCAGCGRCAFACPVDAIQPEEILAQERELSSF